MADRNSYLAYKRDTRYLLYWMLHAANTIIASNPGSTSIRANTTGTVAIASIVPLAKLVAQNIKPIPNLIFRLFESVIEARTQANVVFQQIFSETQDPEIKKSNDSHRNFIDTLTEAFEALRGKPLAEGNDSEKNEETEKLEDVIFANKFSFLSMQGQEEAEEDDDEEDTSTVKKENRRPAKGKKGKKGKGKGRGKPKPAEKGASLDDIPLESYRIIEDASGEVTEYLMAVYSIITQWTTLRQYIQTLWRKVAYKGLNSAVAGALSNMAVAMIKQTENMIFVEFPGHESFEIIMNTITRGDIQKAQGMFYTVLHKYDPTTKQFEKVMERDVDVKERFMFHTYNDLLDFIKDFQANRTGKPTKRMQTELRDWDVNMDLKKASSEERLRWRRGYTINWLYDLVNVFSSIVVQRNTLKGEKWDLATVDWSKNGPWHEHRRLFGLNEFAGSVASWVYQKSLDDVRSKILPHHLFELACIVDAFTASRGWTTSGANVDKLSAPAPNFRPRRDIDLFLDRDDQHFGRGYCSGITVVKQFLRKSAVMNNDPMRHDLIIALLDEVLYEFVNWLGECKYMSGLDTIPPSRFTNTNSNGLWEYSPYLCGVGLLEALDIAYRVGLHLWDAVPEMMCTIHMHNMLVQKGLIAQPVGLWSTLETLFEASFFGKKPPTSGFYTAFLNVSVRGPSRSEFTRRRAARLASLSGKKDLTKIFDPDLNHLFKQKSLINLFSDAGWLPARISDDDIPLSSVYAMNMIGRTKYLKDPKTGRRILEETGLVRRAKANGMTDESLSEISEAQESLYNQPISLDSYPELAKEYEGYKMAPMKKPGSELTDVKVLGLIKVDLIGDICGELRPLSSLNYIWVFSKAIMFFMRLEESLEKINHLEWKRVYTGNATREKRAALTTAVMAGDDTELMKIVAAEFQNPRSGFMDSIYWDDLESIKTMVKEDEDADPTNACVMILEIPCGAQNYVY
ncbi:hypothetical protein H072_6698 [Dactylellina haptotyla CBS 200.50]|uniref:DUF6604 domain-containing protein n=1 Tax=Dactylellina haptotyla (strain CBS 200.50) TaxID=1284197 RepID=S8BJN1_DACHA|nr:hypothetical protein H072_6698 [Dactylellina haptotyla CBS 200.50]